MLIAPRSSVDCSKNDTDLERATSVGSRQSSKSPREAHVLTVYAEETLVRPSDPFGLGTTRLFLAHMGLALCLFLATTDGTIVSTSLPTITAELRGSTTLYSWVGTSYLLAQTIIQPILAKLCQFAGFKAVLYLCISIFLLASAASGAAGNLFSLVVFRAFQGIGAGGIITVVWTIMSKLVWPEDRGHWQTFMSITWALSAISGPLLGGVFSEKVSWRWGFFINLPIGVIACGLVLPCLWSVVLVDDLDDCKTSMKSGKSWMSIFWRFDFVGLFLIAGGAVSLLLGFSLASTSGWTSALALGLLITAFVLLTGALLYEAFCTEYGVIPAPFFKDRTIGIIMVISFLQTFTYTAITYYLALYFQAVLGASALLAGVSMLSFSLTCAVLSAPISIYLAPRFQLKWLVCMGFGLTAGGFGFMTLLSPHSSSAARSCLPLIVGLGFSFLLKLPNDLLNTTLKDKHMASANGNFFLVRTMGCTTGLAIAAAVFTSRLQHLLAPVGYVIDLDDVKWQELVRIEPLETRRIVLAAVSGALSTVWLLCCIILALSCLLCIFIHSPTPITTITPSTSEPVSQTSTQVGDIDIQAKV